MAKRNYKVKRLDRRHKGYGLMKYFVEMYYSANATEDFYQIKNWCIDQWGITRPIDDWRTGRNVVPIPPDVNPAWTYIRDEFRTRILFAEKEEAALFTLRWCGV